MKFSLFVPLAFALVGWGFRARGADAEKRDGKVVPEVEARFIRDWDWGLFTFMDYGNDKTNPKWTALCKVKGDEVYDSSPSQSFYEERLGKRK